jgi:hypothetical protein
MLPSLRYYKEIYESSSHEWSNPVSSSGTIETIHDNNNGVLWSNRKTSGIVLSDVQLSRFKRSYIPGTFSKPYDPYTGVGVEVHGDLAGYFVEPSVGGVILPLGTIQQELLMRCYSQMYASDMMAGESLGELGETVAMLHRPLGKARDLLSRMLGRANRSMRKGRYRLMAEASQEAWLQGRYGLTPLLMDMQTIFKRSLEARGAIYKRPNLVVRHGKTQSGSTTGTIPRQNPWPMLLTEGEWSCTAQRKTSAGVIYCHYDSRSDDSIASIMGSRARDVIPTIWNLMPRSFVVDWFIGIGDWLQVISPEPRINVLGNWITVINEIDTTCVGKVVYPNPMPDPNFYYRGGLGSSTRNSFSYIRVCNNTVAAFPIVKGLNLSRLHQIDALALSLDPLLGLLDKLRH